MLVYQTRLHRRLMDESEKGLLAAVADGEARWGHIAEEVVYDCRKYSAWESRHARLLQPAAHTRRRTKTIALLRRIGIDLVHRRALFDTLRERRLVGEPRKRLFRIFYGPRDFTNAVLAEHFQYQLSVASCLSTNWLTEVCEDPVGSYLLRKYETAYREYFSAYCDWQLNEDPLLTDVLRLSMRSARFEADRVKDALVAGRDLKVREGTSIRLGILRRTPVSEVSAGGDRRMLKAAAGQSLRARACQARCSPMKVDTKK